MIDILSELWRLLGEFWEYLKIFLAIVGAVSILYHVFIKPILTWRDLSRMEKTYAKALKFAREFSQVVRPTLAGLPPEIIVETTYKGERVIHSKVRSFFKKIMHKILGRECIRVTVFSEMDYPEQLAFMIKQVFEHRFSYENVLDASLRDTLVKYYAYKFAVMVGREVVDRKTLNILEREFQETKDVVGGLAYPAHHWGMALYEAAEVMKVNEDNIRSRS